MVTEGDLLPRVEIGTGGTSPGRLTTFLFPGPDRGALHDDPCSPGRRRDDERRGDCDGGDLRGHDRGVDAAAPHQADSNCMRSRLLGIVKRADLIRRVGEVLTTPEPETDDKT